MKKWLIVISLVSVLLLVGCENENKPTNVPSNTNISSSTNTTNESNEHKIVKNGETYTDEQLIELIKAYRKEKDLYIPENIEISAYNGNIVSFHLYDVEDDHTATTDWYYIDNRDGSGENILGEHIQLVK